MAKANRFNDRSSRSSRNLQVDETFERGIFYTKNVLGKGTNRFLLNYRLKDNGAIIGPRKGFKQAQTPIAVSNHTSQTEPHIAYHGVYDDVDGIEYFGDIVISLGTKGADTYNGTYAWGALNRGQGADYEALSASGLGTFRGEKFSNVEMHDFAPTDILKPVYSIVRGRLFVIMDGDITRLRVSTTDITAEPITPQTLSIAESTSKGFNLLLDNPYTFDNQEAGALDLEGIIPYNTTETAIRLSANHGETIRFMLNYKYDQGAIYRVKWEYKQFDAEAWNVLQEYVDSSSYTGGDDIHRDITPKDDVFMLRVSMGVESGTGIDPATEEMILYPKYEMNDAYLRNIANQNYDLHTAKGMFGYNEMLGLYGVAGAENTLFFSEYHNFGYFPFPHYSIELDEQISGGPLPINMTTATIQQNLSIGGFDKTTIQAYKTLIYFKNADRYYLIQPNMMTDRIDDLQIKELDTPIKDLLNNLKEVIEKDVLDDTYNLVLTADTELLDYTNYVDNDVFRIIYKCKAYPKDQDPIIIDFVLSFDLAVGAWVTEVYETNKTTLPLSTAKTNTALLFNSYYSSGNTYLQVLQQTSDNFSDNFTLNNAERTIKNYQMIDSGARNHNAYYLKRYREIQFQINNRQGEPLEFNSEFLIDGRTRQTYASYEVQHDDDPASPNYGTITYVRSYNTTFEVGGETLLDIWELDSSYFPELDKVKARFKISGKGRYPRMRLVSLNEKDYELISYGWVFRTQSAR
jgi:hypothetical protein